MSNDYKNIIWAAQSKVKEYLAGKTVMVTGAGGSIGSELCKQICTFSPDRLIMVDQSEFGLFHIDNDLQPKYNNVSIVPVICDIKQRVKIDRVFNRYHPHIIFHAAAYKYVTLMEYNKMEAIENNTIGIKVLIETATHHNVERFIAISTDKAVNPINYMGISKALCEKVVQCSDLRSCIVRFGNVLGSSGSVIPVFEKQIANNEPLTVTHADMKRFLMTIPDAVHLIIECGSLANSGEVYMLDMGEQVSIMRIAQEMLKLSGKNLPIHIIGIRAGEKIEESLLWNHEKEANTEIPKVKLVRSMLSFDKIEFYRDMCDIEKHILDEDCLKLVESITKKYLPVTE